MRHLDYFAVHPVLPVPLVLTYRVVDVDPSVLRYMLPTGAVTTFSGDPAPDWMMTPLLANEILLVAADITRSVAAVSASTDRLWKSVSALFLRLTEVDDAETIRCLAVELGDPAI
jgi:hypothetical protein